MDVEFKLLKMIHESSSISQRKLSRASNVSLGKVNKELKNFEDKGYIIINRDTKSISYKLTSKGIEHLENYIEIYNKTKLQVTPNDKYKKINKAVILAAGSQKGFSCPPTLLKIGETTFLNRIISLLRKNEITDIIVVGGYEINNLKSYLDKDIKLLYNERYNETGSMFSLQLARDIIKDDFLLIESDLIFEEKILKDIISSEYRDCACITNADMVGDELYVEIRDNLIYKLSKDIRQFNSIDGKFMGITKISSELFSLMLNEYKDNKNPLINYEYTLLDVARKYNINYIFIEDLIWGEVNNLKEYEYVKDFIYKKIKDTD